MFWICGQYITDLLIVGDSVTLAADQLQEKKKAHKEIFPFCFLETINESLFFYQVSELGEQELANFKRTFNKSANMQLHLYVRHVLVQSLYSVDND